MNKKRIIAIILAVVLFLGILTGVLIIIRNNKEPVNVFKVSDMAMMGYMGEQTERYGTVTSDKLQNVYLSDTQTVTEVFVSEGQNVKVGDKLMSYDTTLTDIQIQRKKLEVEKLKLRLANAKDDLSNINSLKPYTPPAIPDPTPVPTPAPTVEPTVKPGKPVSPPELLGGSGTAQDPYLWAWDNSCSFTPDFIATVMNGQDSAYAVFQVYEGNNTSEALKSSYGFVFTKSAEGIVAFSTFDWDTGEQPEKGDAEENVPEETYSEPVDSGETYTASEIAEMKASKEKEIRDLDLSARMAQVEYEKQLSEINDGVVTAKYDGLVTKVTDADTAKKEKAPMIRVTGGGGYYIRGSLSEYDIQTVSVGDAVTVSSPETGETFEGKITEISDYPDTGDTGYVSGNPNVSMYPFKIFVEATAQMKENEYVSISFQTQNTTGGLYIDTPFILTEEGKSFVYVRGENGRLEKRSIKTGITVYGSSVQILDGITEEDYIAFPYGKNVAEGAKTQEASIDQLWG